MSFGKSDNTARNASWRNLDSTLQEMSNQPLQEAAQAMSVGNWAADLLTGGGVGSPDTPRGKDAWSGYWWADPTTGFSGAKGSGGSIGDGSTGASDGTMQYGISGGWAKEAGPILGTAYEQNVYDINQANALEKSYFTRASNDYSQIQQDRQQTQEVQKLLASDVTQMGQDYSQIGADRAATQQLESGTGLYASQQAYVDQAVASGKAAVQQRLASMGIAESTQNTMLQNEVQQQGASTAGQLIQGNISLSEAQQQLDQTLYGVDVSRYNVDVGRQTADIEQQKTDQATYQLDSSAGIAEQQVSQNAVNGLLNIQTSLEQTYKDSQAAASAFFQNALAPYAYILSDLSTRTQLNEANAQIKSGAGASNASGLGSFLGGLGSLLGTSTGGAGAAAGFTGTLTGAGAAGATAGAGAAGGGSSLLGLIVAALGSL